MLPSRSIEIALEVSVAVFGVQLSGELGKLVLVAHVLENDQVLGIKQYVPAETSMLEQVLCDKYYADVPMMTAVGEEITYVPGLGLVQEIV